MIIKGNIIFFKSTPDSYYREFHSFKCNTVRRLEKGEKDAFQRFRHSLTADSKICITTTFHSGDKANFERYITDISDFEDLIIISWRHEV